MQLDLGRDEGAVMRRRMKTVACDFLVMNLLPEKMMQHPGGAGVGVLMPHQMIRMERSSCSLFGPFCRQHLLENSNCEVSMNVCPQSYDAFHHPQQLNHSQGPEETPHQKVACWILRLMVIPDS